MSEVRATPTIDSADGTRSEPDATEAAYVAILGEVTGGPVGVDSHFFDDLGADSMTMARFCARVRKSSGLPQVSMKDVYRSSTVRGLVEALATSAGTVSPEPAGQEPVADRPLAGGSEGRPRFVLCAIVQIGLILGLAYVGAVLVGLGFQWVAWRAGPLDGLLRYLLLPSVYRWVTADTGFLGLYGRGVLVGGLAFLVWCALPVVAKWLLIGRWRSRRIRIWSLRYLRFWIVKSLVRASPLVLFVGSPLYPAYLRALGAKIGRRVLILTPVVPVCTDLLTIGADTVVRKGALFPGYRAVDGVIETGPVTLGEGAFVSEATVLEIHTRIGDGGQLGHSSSLHLGQSIPSGQSWHGSPARPGEVSYQRAGVDHRQRLRPVLYAAWQLVTGLLGAAPLLAAAMIWLLGRLPGLGGVLNPQRQVITGWPLLGAVLVTTTALLVAGYLAGLLLVAAVPRLLHRGLTADTSYPLYGARYWLHRTVSLATNLRAYTWLFGDSVLITGYLRLIGYRLKPLVQTGSNFGLDVRHENPYLSRLGAGTVVADGLSMMNAEYSCTSFRLSGTTIGARNYLGNNIVYPAGGRTGDDCLLATKVMVPIDGAVREGVGLLGSPPFEIPRSVERDNRFELRDEAELRARLRAKNLHNLTTAALYLIAVWTRVVVLSGLALLLLDLLPVRGTVVAALAAIPGLVFGYAHIVLVERAVRRLPALRPDGCSVYDQAFWRHERYWKVSQVAPIMVFDGTPMKSLLWRLLGAQVGRQVFDDGCHLTERPFTIIGDHCTLNAASIVQCHSQEDGAFKSDTVVLGDGVTLGIGAFVHYGVTIGAGSTIEADSFLMKGEAVAPQTRWSGNPAGERTGTPYRPARSDSAMVSVESCLITTDRMDEVPGS